MYSADIELIGNPFISRGASALLYPTLNVGPAFTKFLRPARQYEYVHVLIILSTSSNARRRNHTRNTFLGILHSWDCFARVFV